MHMTINQIRFEIVTNQEQKSREIDVRKFLHGQVPDLCIGLHHMTKSGYLVMLHQHNRVITSRFLRL